MPFLNWTCNKCNCEFSLYVDYNKESTVKCEKCGSEDVSKIFKLLEKQCGPIVGGLYIKHDALMNDYVKAVDKENAQKIKDFKGRKKR